MKYVYMLSGDERERELALAEAFALAGGRQCAAKLVEADRRIDIAQTGYVTCGIELIAKGATLEKVCGELAGAEVASEGFGIEVKRIPRGLKVHRHATADALGLVIQGRPNLDHPSECFVAFATSEGLWFGRKLEAGEPEWRGLAKKPYDCSSALPARVARAVCNLLVRGGESVVDPCCGSGSLLIHAAFLGARVTGFDINKKMVGATNKNLTHFGFQRAASPGDAAEVEGSYDLVLANVPYGNMSAVSEEEVGPMVTNIARLAPRGAIIAVRDLSDSVRAAGADVRQVIRLHKFSVTRLILVYERR